MKNANLKNKNMVTTLSIFVLVMAVLPVASATNSSALVISPPSPWARIVITLVNQEPDPVEPGSFVDVRFKFENKGSENAEDITVELLPEFPFSVYKGESVQKIGSVHGRQIGEIGRIVKYRLEVDKDAAEGDNELKLRYKIGSGQWIELSPFEINIRTHDAILSVESVASEDDEIKPGAKSSITVKVKNMADSLLKTIKLKLDLSGTPFAPLKDTNEKTIAQLSSKEEAAIKFDLMAEPNAKSNIYKVPLSIKYNDKLGNKYEKNNTIGLIIGGVPELSVSIDKTDIYTGNKNGKVIIKFVNKGVVDIKFLNAKLTQTDAFKLLSAEDAYIGNIDSDDYETAEFSIYLNPTKEKSVVLPLSIEYKDATNRDYSNQISLELNLYSITEAKKLGLIKGNGTIGILLTLAIIVAGLWLYRRWRKKAKK